MKIDPEKTDVGGFNFEFLRLLSSQTAGAAEIGECLTTIARIKSDSFESWITEWRRTADRVAKAAGSLVHRGDRVGARAAYRVRGRRALQAGTASRRGVEATAQNS